MTIHQRGTRYNKLSKLGNILSGVALDYPFIPLPGEK